MRNLAKKDEPRLKHAINIHVRLDDHGDRKTPEAKPLRLVIFGGIVFGEVGVVDVEPFLHRIAVPLCHRHKDRPCIRALWPKHEVYTAKNSLLRPRQSVVVLGRHAHHEQGGEELRGRSKSTRPAHPDEHDQVEKCRWAELGELDFVQLQHLWQKVVTWKAEPGGEKGGEHHRSPVPGRRDNVFARTGHLALRKDAGEDKLGQVGLLDKKLAKVARPTIAEAARVFARRSGLSRLARSHRIRDERGGEDRRRKARAGMIGLKARESDSGKNEKWGGVIATWDEGCIARSHDGSTPTQPQPDTCQMVDGTVNSHRAGPHSGRLEPRKTKRPTEPDTVHFQFQTT